MVAKAFILIETEVGKNQEVISKLLELEGVESVDSVTGPYDVIAVIEGKNMAEIGNVVTRRIQSTPGLSRTVACIAV